MTQCNKWKDKWQIHDSKISQLNSVFVGGCGDWEITVYNNFLLIIIWRFMITK